MPHDLDKAEQAHRHGRGPTSRVAPVGRYVQPLRALGLAQMCRLVARDRCVTPPRSKPNVLSSSRRAPSIPFLLLLLMLLTIGATHRRASAGLGPHAGNVHFVAEGVV